MSKPAIQFDNVMDNIPFYDKWQLGEGIPIVKTFFVQDLKKVELKPWDEPAAAARLSIWKARKARPAPMSAKSQRGKN